MLSDQEFINGFEAKELDPSNFNHLGHLRIAWLYLRDHDTDTAIEKTCNGIKAYAESLGVTDKFHYSLTAAAVYIMAARMQPGEQISFDAFLDREPDLVTALPSILASHYSSSILSSKPARQGYVEPDLKPFLTQEPA